jgi:hypothetical protein
MMRTDSYGAQMQQMRADKALRRKYFDPETLTEGERVPFRSDDDDTDDRAWNDAERRLSQRDLVLIDDGGDGYLCTTTNFQVGDRVAGGTTPEDRDTGTVSGFNSLGVLVKWDSGVRTSQPSSLLLHEDDAQ